MALSDMELLTSCLWSDRPSPVPDPRAYGGPSCHLGKKREEFSLYFFRDPVEKTERSESDQKPGLLLSFPATLSMSLEKDRRSSTDLG